MRELEYPFDSGLLLRKRRALKKELLKSPGLIEKRIAVLGGSTTHDIKEMLELFLLGYGIRPVFFESEYAQYWQDAVFGNPELDALKPELIFIHTSSRNITTWPELGQSAEEVEKLLEGQAAHFTAMWDALRERFHCPIIQNNFEYPYFRLLGNRDAVDIHGRVNFVMRLNLRFSEEAGRRADLFLNDICWQAADYGLSKWADPSSWHMYKYCLALDAIPTLAFNAANIVKSVFGKNKKALALDLDNTLWGGIVGDDGPENLELGQETPMGQGFTEFQAYLKLLQRQGVLLNVISKNEPDNAMAGLKHPQMLLKPEDFISVKANWEPKSANLVQMAQELTLLPEAFVFVDDNPAEREIIRRQVPGAAVPELGNVEQYIAAIDRAGYFENTALSADDLKRSEMYRENVKRAQLQNSFADYRDYLLSLDMRAVIRPFEEPYLARIAQLTNKSNQFNLTTRRYTREEIEQTAQDGRFVTLYGKLEDCFGDNGVVALVIGEAQGETLDLILWLMSCRVLKRDMELAMLDTLAETALRRDFKYLRGHYYPTVKNAMVRDFYGALGFEKLGEDENGNSEWLLPLEGYKKRNGVIRVTEEQA